MRPFFYVLAYIGLSLLVGRFGRQRRLGFVGFFAVSLVISPPFALLLLYLTETTRPLEPLPPGRNRP